MMVPMDQDIIPEHDALIKLSSQEMLHHDPRRRRKALVNFVNIPHDALDFSLYPEFSEALNDDYELCRTLAIKLISSMSSRYADGLVFQKGTAEQIRLEDDAFANICKMITDADTQVRIEAAKSLSKFKTVSLHYLLATLDKREVVIHSGAFVYGLEDEKKDVRMAALDSLCKLSKSHPKFAERSMDHIVDMFNDEIDDIRLKAILSLQYIDNVALRDDQVEIILTALDSPSMDIREALHRMLSDVHLTSPYSLRRCIETILINLSRYPQDRLSIFECFKSLGQNHGDYVYMLVNELLAVHPYLKLSEQSLIDDNYIGTLIIVFNACSKKPQILDRLESHTLQHQAYMRHTLPNFMPQNEIIRSNLATPLFFVSIFERLGKMLKCDQQISQQAKTSLMEMSLKDLKSFGLVEPDFRASTEFYQMVIESVLLISKIICKQDWMYSNLSLILIRRVLERTFSLSRKYHKLTTIQKCCIQQLRVQALAIELVSFINSCNSSALDICDNFIEEVRLLNQYLESEPYLDSIALSSLTNSILEELSSLDQPKPGTVARKLEPLFTKQSSLALDQINETLMLLIESQNIDDLLRMKMSSARFNSTEDKNDTCHKFTAGLVMALTVDVCVENIKNTDDIRLKLLYPDKQAHIIVPIANHFRLLSSDDKYSETCSYRLYTTINISHGIWTDPSFVELSVILDYRDNQSSMLDMNYNHHPHHSHQNHHTSTNNHHNHTIISSDQIYGSLEESQTIELCPAKSLKVHPQNIRGFL